MLPPKGFSAVVNGERDHDFPRRGEIWLVETPNMPTDPHQPRPGLIVSSDRLNQSLDHVIVVPIFFSNRPGPTHVPIRSGVGGIAHDSVFYCEEVTTLHHEYIIDGPLGGTVSLSLLGRVNRAIRRALGEVVSEPS
jgi:mRNA-degrading endonuclease toxin of MazEF toxin-antitoxin module